MFDQFTNLYSLSKTLRFELKPVGETAEYIEDFKSKYLKEVVQRDEMRAEDYKIIKEIIDDCHREYIEEKLSSHVNPDTGEMWITPDDFEDAFSHYQRLKDEPHDKKIRTEWEGTQTALRKKLVKSFTGDGDLFNKMLFTNKLPQSLKKKGQWEEHKDIVESFNKFTTYFSGFHDNRKNMYTDEDQSTAIAYRLMNENLPRFFNNCIHYKKILEKYTELDLLIDNELLTKMGVKYLGEIFQPRYFINLFPQSGIDKYQQLLGGKVEESGEKIQGLNEQINLFRQQVQKAAKQNAEANNEKSQKIRDLSGFTGLYKQILSDREAISFIPEAFDNDQQLLKAIAAFIDCATKQEGLLENLENTINKLEEADTQRVYIKSSGLTAISQSLFGSYRVIDNALSDYAENNFSTLRKRDQYTEQKVFSLAELDEILTSYIQSLEDDNPLCEQLANIKEPERPIYNYFLQAIKTIRTTQSEQIGLDDKIVEVRPLLSIQELSKDRSLPKNEEDKGGKGYQQVQTIQKLLEAFIQISHVVKPLYLVDGRKPIDMPDMDTGFYGLFSKSYEAYSQPVITLYNKARNHLTKKPFLTDKIKINFDMPTLLKGWDTNKETDNASILFEKGGLYYLGIMHPKYRNLFDYAIGIDDIGNDKKTTQKNLLKEKIIAINQEDHYRKIVYKLLPGANKMLPKVFFSKSRIEYFSPSADVIRIRNTASHSKNGIPQKGCKKDNFNINDCHKMIDFYKASINKHPEWKEYDFDFSPTDSYEDLSSFYREVEHQGYRMSFHMIKKQYIDDCVAQGKLFLFEIYNKDFSAYSKGKPNLHTLYWKGLFEPENVKDVVLKLNGEAEIFYRKHSIKQADIITHDSNLPIENKNINNPKKVSRFEYDIIKDKRYTQDKFQFHVPITINFKAQGVSPFNDFINNTLQKSSDIHVIGIDRGERHLLYYTVINQKGEIVEQGSLNKINTDQGYDIDYQQKLHHKEKERDLARKSWSTVENIKELKAGYLSHVVHKLTTLIVKHNAIVCLEDLNFGFKRGRFHVEKQVYQKFEKALIDKLNYLVFKSNTPEMAGGYLNGYQLTAPFISFEKLGKQSGILFYVQSAYTSKIDPATGFINFLYTQYQSLAKSKEFFESFDRIHYNAEKDYFEFAFDYSNFPIKQNITNYPTSWVACTHGNIRYSNKRNQQGQWETETIYVTEQLKSLFSDSSIDYQNGKDLRVAISLNKDTRFYKTLYWLLKLTLSLRHSKAGTDDDFILSPIANNNGVFFDSRNAKASLPQDADANGAYNIALKGLWNLEKIRSWDGESKLNLAMKNEDWFSFIQQRIN